MAYENGWKDGWSSADHAETSYSPAANERAVRAAAWEASERRRVDEQQSAIDKAIQERRERREAQEQYEANQRIREEKENADKLNRRRAVNIIVIQKREQYNRKSFLKRAVATLRGKSFNQMKDQIKMDAEQIVADMNRFEVEAFVKREGRQR